MENFTVGYAPEEEHNNSQGYDEETIPLVRGFWICHSIVAATAFLLNLVMSTILVRSPLLEKSFYSLMLIFNIVTVLFQVIIILDVIVSHESSDDKIVLPIRILANCVQLTSWYFTSALVFLIGLNRLAILTTSPISSILASRKNVLWCSFILFVFSTIAGVLFSGIIIDISEILGVANGFDFSRYGIFSAVDCFFASLPLCSCLFYLAAFKKVRSIRGSSTASVATDKAETTIMKQGFLICIFFMIPEIALLTSRYGFDFYSDFYVIFGMIFDITTNLPPIGFPIIVFMCSKEFRKLFRVNCSKQMHQIHAIKTSPHRG